MSKSRNRNLAELIDGTGAGTSSLAVYATKENLPATGLTSGDQAYVSNTSRFYISNGSGWYNVALVNATPALTISPTGAIVLSTAGSATTITLTGTDSDNAVSGLTFSVDSDGSFNGLATLSQDSSVFTITPRSEDSATTTSSTLTFKASDGISFGSGDRTLTLEFKVANSNHTTLMLKADTAGTDNQVDSSTNAHTITENGNVTSTALTPYHPGGYSVYFDGTGDYMTIPHNTGFDFGTGDFTVECYIYSPSFAGDQSIVGTYDNGGSSGFLLQLNGTAIRFYKGSSLTNVDASSYLTVNTWHHITVTRSGTDLRTFIDGTLLDTTTNSTDFTYTGLLYIGRLQHSSVTQYVNGYIRDLRVVKGTAVYTSTYTPPLAPLTAISGTSLLACHLPYIADGSTNGHAITIYGNTSTKRFGPYDYKKYTKADYGGSVYFDGTGDYLQIPDNNGFELDGDFTIELWFNKSSTTSGTYCSVFGGNGSGSNGWNIYITNSNGAISFFHSTFLLTYAEGVIDDNWYHVAVSRSSNTLKLFVNGVERHSITNSTTFNQNDANAGTRIGYDIGANGYFNGYISNVRLIKGTGIYTSAFTPPTEPLTAITNTELLTCTNKNNIFEQADGGQVMTKNGNVTASNTQRNFLTSSAIYFDGNGDYIDFVKKDDYSFESGIDFTVEGWWYMNSVASRPPFIAMGTGVDASPAHYSDWNLYYNSSNNLNWYAYSNGGNVLRQFAWTPAINTWYHIAVTRHGTNMRAFINGTQIGTTLTDSTAWTGYSGSRPLRIGRWQYGGGTNGYLNGYAQDIRITKGLARYTANFTPPTVEFSG